MELAVLLFVVALVIVLIVLYFVPTVIAIRRKSDNITGIALLNIFLGWSTLGWLAAFFWALLSDPRSNADKGDIDPHTGETPKEG